MMSTFSVVVDDDIDPTNFKEVVWAISTRCNPTEDIDILRQAQSNMVEPTLRPEDKKSGMVFSSRAIIRAVRPFDMIKNGTFADVAEKPPEILNAVKEKYKDILK